MIFTAFLFFFAPLQGETAGSIMAHVAENQDRAEQAREAYVYHQNVLVRVNHNNGKLAHERYSEYTVTPTATGIKKEQTLFTGKYIDRGKKIEYHDPKEQHGNWTMQMDSEICDSFSSDFTSSESKDGISRNLFPLTAKEQKNYIFHLAGTEDYRGAPVYRITFEPVSEEGERPWEGEALIDQKEYQPVLITTHLAIKIPLFVKAVLGTNIQHMGFKVTYKKFDDGLWFPVVYGGELKVRALFLYARRIGISMQNSGFQKADVNSTVTFERQ